MSSVRAWSVLSLIILLGCASGPKPKDLPTPKLIQYAERLLEEEDYKSALKAYESLLKRPLPEEIESDALYQAGQLALHENQPQKALNYLEEYLLRAPESPNRNEAIKKIGLALLDLGRFEMAKSSLSELASSNDWLVHAYLYQASKGMQEPRPKRVGYLIRALTLAQDPKDRAALESLLVEEYRDVDYASFMELADKVSRRDLKEALLYAWLVRARNENNSSEIVRSLDAWRKIGGPQVIPESLLKGPVFVGAKPDREILEAFQKPRKKIVVLLPLTGSLSQIGQEALKGALLGVGALAGQSSGIPDIAELAFLDTSQDPFFIEKRLDEFSKDPDVVLAVGPLVSDLAVPLANRANVRGLPIVLLAPRKGLTQIGPWVFRNAIHARIQAETLSHYAVRSMRALKFVIVYSEDSYGTELSEAFIEALGGAGGSVLASFPYAPTQTNLGLLAMRVKAMNPDGVFVADAPKQGVNVVQALKGAIGNAPLILLPNSFNELDLAQRFGPILDGCVFSDAYNPQALSPSAKSFEARFTQAFQANPTPLSARTFDTVGLALYTLKPCLDSGEAQLRLCLAEGLKRAGSFNGVGSPIRFDKDRDLAGPLFLFQFHQGRIVQLQGPRA